MTEETRTEAEKELMKRFRESQANAKLAQNYKRTLADTDIAAYDAVLAHVKTDKNGLNDYSALKTPEVQAQIDEAMNKVYDDRAAAISSGDFYSKDRTFKDAIRSTGVVGPSSEMISGAVKQLGENMNWGDFHNGMDGTRQQLEELLGNAGRRAWKGFDPAKAGKELGGKFKDLSGAVSYASALETLYGKK